MGQHRLPPVIHARYPLEAAHEALGVLEAGQQFGKIVLGIRTSHGAQLHAEHPRNEWLRDDHEQLPRDGSS
jgi:hypothetical protein